MKRSNHNKSPQWNEKRAKNGMSHRKSSKNRNDNSSGKQQNQAGNSDTNNPNANNKLNNQKKKNNKKGLIQTGHFGSFLKGQEWSDEMLLGPLPTTNDPRFSDLECIAQFLADYRAMSTLHVHARRSNNNSPTNGSSCSNNNNANNNKTLSCHSHNASTSYYMPVIQDFALTQQDRQSAGLRTNTSRETSVGMAQVVESHTKALKAAMEHVDPVHSTVFKHDQSATNDNDHDDQDRLVPTEQTLGLWHSILVANTTTAASVTTNNSDTTSRTPTIATSCIPSAIQQSSFSYSSFRKARAKAGKTVFCPPTQIAKEFRQFRSAMIRYCHQWESKIMPLLERKRSGSIAITQMDGGAATELAHRMTQQQHTSIYHALGVAAMYLFGIVDIHMYSDGNGRMSRIGANWMLKRMLGWPFTITLVANPQQRREYISALQHAVNCIQVGQKQNKKDKNKENNKKGPTDSTLPTESAIFRPLILLLLDRMANAVRECQRKLTEKSQLTQAAEEARIARKVREETASGRCVICLDDNPNIATLCCGQGVHLNCVAEWLSNNSNCVYCRGPLPQLKLQRPAPPPEEGEEVQDVAIVSELANVLALPDANMAAATAAAVSRLNSNPAFLNIIRRILQANQNAEDNVSMHSATTTILSSDEEEEEEDAENENGDDESNSSNDTTYMMCVSDTCIRSTQTWCPCGMCSRCCASSGIHCWYHDGRINPTNEEDTALLFLDNSDDDDDDDDEDTTTYQQGSEDEEDDEQPTTRSAWNVAVGDNRDTTTYLDGGEEEDETAQDDTTTYTGDNHDTNTRLLGPHQSHHQRTVCCSTRDCHNRPAADCQNHMCGRCCVLFGQYSCLRHNTGTYAN